MMRSPRRTTPPRRTSALPSSTIFSSPSLRCGRRVRRSAWSRGSRVATPTDCARASAAATANRRQLAVTAPERRALESPALPDGPARRRGPRRWPNRGQQRNAQRSQRETQKQRGVRRQARHLESVARSGQDGAPIIGIAPLDSVRAVHPKLMTTTSSPAVCDPRLNQLAAWLRALPAELRIEPDTLQPASADASFRRYFRVDAGGGTLIVMDAPRARKTWARSSASPVCCATPVSTPRA